MQSGKNEKERISLKFLGKTLNYLSNKKGFLGIDNKFNFKEKAIVVPFGLEKTVSYGADTKNGPREILSNGNGGLLFNNNKKDALSIKLIKQKLIKDTERKKMKIISKRNSKKYSLFQHYLKLQKLLS